MKKILSLVLCVTLFSVLLPFGGVIASEETVTPEYISVPVNIADNLYTRKVYTNYGETAKISWNLLSYGGEANIYLDGFKNKQQDTSIYGLVNYDWKNAWGENDNRNTLIMNSTGVEYDMYLETSQKGGGAVDASGNNACFEFDVNKGYYDKISLLLSGITGIGYNGAETDKGIQVVLTYADGTEELKTTGGLYNGWNSAVENIKPYLRLNAISVTDSVTATSGYEKDVTFGDSLRNAPYFISAYDIEANKNKILEKVSVVSGNTKATLEDNGKCTYSSESGANSGANLFAITALTTKELQDKFENEKTVSVPVTISKDLFTRQVFTEYGDTVNISWNMLGATAGKEHLMSVKSMKLGGADSYGNSEKAFSWKREWKKNTDGSFDRTDTDNTAIFDGVEYDMYVVSGATHGGAVDATGNNKTFSFDITPGYYTGISMLANNTGSSKGTGFGVVLKYSDGSEELVQTSNLYGALQDNEADKLTNRMQIRTIAMSTQNEDVSGYEKANTYTTDESTENWVQAYIVPVTATVDSTKKLTGITLVCGNTSATKGEDGKYTFAQQNNVYGNGNLYAITAVTNKGLQQKLEDEKVVSVPVKIADSLYTRKVYTNFGETAELWYNMFAASKDANIHLDSFKNVAQTKYGKNNYSWKNAWGESDRNTLIFNDTEYDMYVKSSATGGGSVDASGNAGVLAFDVEDNYYEKVSMLLSGITGIGYNGGTTDKGLQIVLTYADGTEELKNTGALYYTFSNTVEKLDRPFMMLNAVSKTSEETVNSETVERKVTFGSSVEDWVYAYIMPYEIEVNKDKLLEKISVISGNTKAELNNNGKCVYTYEANANSGANLFAITAVSTKGTMEKDKTTELTALVNGITVDSLTYTRENAGKVSCINKLYKALTADGITLDSNLTVTISGINSKWQTLSAQKPILIGETSNSTYTSGEYTYLQVNATLVNSAVENGISGDVFVALYDKTTNKLLEVKTITSQSFAYGTEVTLNNSFEINANDLDKYEVKAFVWDSLSEMKPISEFAAIK